MTSHQVRLAFDLIETLFPDENCKKIACYLNRKGPLPLPLLIRDTELPPSDVARALSQLSIHDIVQIHQESSNKSARTFYSFHLKRTLDILHYSKCIHSARQLFGCDGELIVEELLLNGRQRMSTLLVKVYQRLVEAGKDPQKNSLESIKNTFRSIVHGQFLHRLSIQDADGTMPKIVEEVTTNSSQIPELNSEACRAFLSSQQDTSDEPSKKRFKPSTTVSFGDENIYWKINFQRFFTHLRDQEIVQAFRSRIDQNAADIMRAVLRLAEGKANVERTIPLSFIEIGKTLQTTNPQFTEDLLQKYLNIMVSDVNNCLIKTGDQGRGTYIVDFQKALTALCRFHIQSFIREKFGSNALRIFNMLEERSCLSQKQIEDMAMIDGKEAQQCVYSMFIDGILTSEELSKTNDFNPTRSFYFFRVNFYKCVLCLLDHSYKTMSNLMQRNTHERDRHQKLIDKRDKVEVILQALREQNAEEEQIKEVEDILSPIEKSQIAKLDSALRRIDLAQLQLTETILLLEDYISVSNALVPVAKKTGARAAVEKALQELSRR